MSDNALRLAAMIIVTLTFIAALFIATWADRAKLDERCEANGGTYIRTVCQHPEEAA